MRGRGEWLLSAALLLTSAGCKPAVTGELPICVAEVAGGTAAEAEQRALPAAVWYAILLDGFDREAMLAGDAPRDCTGAPVSAPTPPPAEPEPREHDSATAIAGCSIADPEPADPLPARALTDADLVIGQGPAGSSLVWVLALQYADGEAAGPVALVEWSAAGVAVRALGRLRGPSQGARLRVEDAGDQRLVIAEGDRCPAEGSGACVRVVRLLPILDGRIATVPLVRADAAAATVEDTAAEQAESTEQAGPLGPARRCLGAPAFALSERHTVGLADGRLRRFEIVRSLRFSGEGPTIAEQVVIEDADPTQPEAPAQRFRTASRERPLVYRDGYFEAPPSLWEDMLASYGSVAAAPED